MSPPDGYWNGPWTSSCRTRCRRGCLPNSARWSRRRKFSTLPCRSPPTSTSTNYYFTGRDAYRTAGERRTDFAVNYLYRVKSARSLQLFGQLQVLNVFNQFQLSGCGGTIFQNGGTVTQTRIDQTVLSNATNASQYATFNPFTTTPALGTNYAFGPKFGQALNRFGYTTPRELRISFGVRF